MVEETEPPEKGYTAGEEIELAELGETLEDRKSRRKDRERGERLARAERWTRLGIYVLVSLAAIYLAIRYTHSAPLVAGGFGLVGGAAWVRQALKSKQGKAQVED